MLVPLGDRDDAVSSLAAMVLGDNETAVSDACSSVEGSV